ncbi:unnamed protein product [Rotaria magnacalcarata]|uniref:Glycosylphosphatidylinositol anchor attachment 1 protein n=2 Tax=Rotaria magnacalcarata TaxID=392030 RepID=A0A819TQH9_9BILA|nr:unnamed protein product [Rotaria magnacalcarata]CAF2080249.1 unnamed protein product [Rotaria magnacalcarata]CAF2253422.1 unnamed protein product [Rotaria magnacalcarata]CAF4028482.1 unnamed protein product [Rotaria magnacalcarata]CAF4078802.1 unnamed protein product [Rotaria magnacalcarata]
MPLLSNLLSRDIPKNFYKFQFQLYSGLFLLGILGFLYLTSPIVSRRTYLSENALSPGLVSSDLYISVEHIRNIMGRLRTGFKNNDIADVIQLMLNENGIEAYKQDIGRNSTDKPEENIYGIVRAPRLASTESIILVAPLYVRTQTKPQQNKANLFGIAHTLAIGFALHRKPYMSKDIILLFPAAQEYGTRVWLDAYYNSNPQASLLDAHAGSIQAGLALEFPYEKFYSIDLRHNGINGQLTNLDLINTVVHLCEKNSIATTFYGVYVELSTNEAFINYIIQSTRTLLLNVFTLATGISNGVHGQFLRYRIEMITIFGSLDKHHEYQNSPVTMRAFDDVIEGFIRSLNNLLERFHQSFFFYLHINRRNFVSIATYMVPLGLIALPALIRSLVIYMSFFTSSSTDSVAMHGRTMKFDAEYSPIFIEIFQCLAFSYVLTWIPLKLSLLGVCLITMLLSPFILRRFRSNVHQFDHFQFITLLIGSALLGCLSLLNFSMALLTACFLMPCYLIAGGIKLDHWFIKFSCRFLFITFLNPLVFLALYHYLAQIIMAGTFVFPDFAQFSNDLDTYFASYHLYNTWTVDVVCLTIVPIWLLLYRSTFGIQF